MHDVRVARRYAQALFTTARRFDVMGAVEDDLNGIVRVLDADPSFREFVTSPLQGQDAKIALFDRLFSDRVTALTMQVLKVMLERRRETELPWLRDEFVRLRREHEGVTYAKVTSAEIMPDGQRWALIAKLQQATGTKVEADFFVDPALIGGATIAYGNDLLDGSIRGAIDRLREKLRHDLLKQA